jgi:AcrR family transcriptional regulator
MVRGSEREQAILNATIELLTEASYEALTIDAVAARAASSKTTIYRRWRGKAELVRAAIENFQDRHHTELTDSGSLRGDLMTILAAARTRATPEFLALMGGLMQAMRADDELRQILWSRLVENTGPFEEIIQRGVRRGELHPAVSADLVHEVTEAMIIRRMSLDLPWDDEFPRHLVDDILLPMLTNSHPTSERSVP